MLSVFAAVLFFIAIGFFAVKDVRSKVSLKKSLAVGGSESVTYSVSAMTCPNCVRSVTEALNKLDDVNSVAVSLDSGTAVVVPSVGYSSQLILDTLAEIGHKGELLAEEEANGSTCSCSSCHH